MNDGLWKDLQGLLPLVARPVRYIDGEYNCLPADLDSATVAFALIYPDTYEVGSSNLGLGILYNILAGIDGVAVDRAFAPWPDMEQLLRARGLPLCGLASRRPLADFDVLAITLQYEMTYVNILTVLDLAGVPLSAEDRSEGDPLVLGGGPCASNPEPVARFFDAILVGDGEEAVVEIAHCLAAAKAAGTSRGDTLRELARIRGVYVPSLYEGARSGEAGGSGGARMVPSDPAAPELVSRRVVADLNAADLPAKPMVPFADVVHDRVALEIMRGCTRGCRFCQAGMTYRPVRERDCGRLLEAAERLIAETGYEGLSLVSLSSSDYSCAATLVQTLCECMRGRGVSVSLPSGRVDAFSVALARSIAGLKKTGLTFAPEAGTQRLRDVINKQVTQEDFERTIAEAFSSGWKKVKLYFMIGLPTETEHDVAGIAEMVAAGARAARSAGAGPGPVFNVSVSSLVPKAASPFMWAAQDDIQTIAAKQEMLRARISRKAAKLHWHDSKLSMIEGIMARGDRGLADVIESAWRLGCRLDAWSEHFKFDLWMRALEANGISAPAYLRLRDDDDVFPWEHLSSGVSRDFLLAEWRNAQRAATTGDCRTEGCTGCGVCREGIDNRMASDSGRDVTPSTQAPGAGASSTQAPAAMDISPGTTDAPIVEPVQAPAGPFRLRIRYSKTGALRFLSHLEVCHAIERGVRRAGLPYAITQGFSPKMKVSYGPPLPVGAAGLAELLDVFLTERPDAKEVTAILDKALPAGLDVKEAAYVEQPSPSISAAARVAAYDVEVFGKRLDPQAADDALRALLDQETWETQRRSQRVRVHLSEAVREAGPLAGSGDRVAQSVSVALGGAHQLRPEALLVAALEQCGFEHDPPVVTRTGLFAQGDEGLVDIMEVSR